MTLCLQKQKSLDNRIQEQVDLITSLKQEVEKLGRGMTESSQAEKKMQTDLDQTKVKFQDMERAERLVRVDLEQSSKRVRLSKVFFLKWVRYVQGILLFCQNINLSIGEKFSPVETCYIALLVYSTLSYLLTLSSQNFPFLMRL